MAVVYRVRDPSRSGDLALKQLTLRNDALRDREANALFEAEFYTLTQLKHPSVIAVYDYGVDSVGPFYTMELLDGGDLTALAPLPYRRACELMVQVCSSLSLLHSRRLLHRDISPRNVRCTQNGMAKLIDFGAMAAMGPSAQTVGTPAFIAPEAMHRLALDARADLFSLGATLYFTLTGRLAFAPRAFSELRDAWRREPAPPSHVVADIPPALDELVLSLLRIDPARRPHSVFEVMQRLAAIAGIAQVESHDAPQAYLATPTLVGRDGELRQFRRHLRAALEGRGRSVLFEGAPGVGRSRLLEACVLEAKIQGATVLRSRGQSASGAAFSSARELVAQMLEALPEVALRCAYELGSASMLLAAPENTTGSDVAPAQVLELATLPTERYALQTALASWIERVCQDQPIVIAVDDMERVDEASLAMLAALAHGASGSRLLIVGTLQQTEQRGLLALGILRRHSYGTGLSPLTAAEIEAMFASVFGNAPHVALVSDRIQRLAHGNPRAALALAQHMLDRGLIRYADGSWSLPPELSVHDLPNNAEEALRAQLEQLPELARHLACMQALALEAPWTRADYAQLAGPKAHAELADALATLLRLGVLTDNGGTYSLSHHGIRSCLIAQLTDEQQTNYHGALADLFARAPAAGGVEVHHLLLAGHSARALERLGSLLAALPAGGLLYERTQLEPKVLAAVLERSLPLAVAQGRPPRELREIARQLIGLSVQTDNKLYYRYAASWREQLTQDSGLADYLALPETLPAAERLKQALDANAARYAAAPAEQRGYAPDEAVRYLAQYVTTSIVIGSRASDTRLLASLPSMLEPFAPLSPMLHALWQNVIAGGEMNYKAQPEQARARVLKVYEQLADVSGRELPNVNAIRNAIAYAVGALEVRLGYPTALQWIEIMEKDPLQQVNGVLLRRLLCIYDGDAEGAEKHRRRAEVLAVQASARQMFDTPFLIELAAQVHAGDLAGIGQVADRITKVAAEAPGWRAQQHLAHGYFQRLRGDLLSAKHAFERSLAVANPESIDPPPNLNAWVSAVAGYTTVLMDLGHVEEARSVGRRAYEQCQVLAVGDGAANLVRALALAEAKLGEYQLAAERLDRLIEQREDMVPSRRSVDYDARACVAIWGKDPTTAARYAELAAKQYRIGTPARSLRHGRLQEEAKQAGLALEVPLTAFESSVLGGARLRDGHTARTRVAAAFEQVDEPEARAQRALSLLCDSSRTRAGQLYVMRAGALVRAASLQLQPDAALDTFANSYWQQQLEDTGQTVIEIEGACLPGLAGTSVWTSRIGIEYRLTLLKCQLDDNLAYVGLVALAAHADQGLSPEYWELATAIGTRLLELGDAEAVAPD